MESKKIKNFQDLITKFDPLKKDNTLIFRGQSDESWSLKPKAGRKEILQHYTKTFNDHHAFKAWKRYAVFHLDRHPDNEWDWLAIAQHHGLATRLLDWTKNPLVAAYFACFENPSEDGALFYYKLKDLFETDKKSDPFKLKKFDVFFPSGLASRIINQRGIFTITDKPEENLEKQVPEIKKVIIKKDAKKDIISSLDFFGINELSLFQDLDSLSQYLNKYIVKVGKNKKDVENALILSEESYKE